MFWLGASLPILNWLSFSLIAYFQIPARAMTGPWLWLCLWAALCLGAMFPIRTLFRGLAVALSLSSLLAVVQWLQWTGPPHPGGLLYNSAAHAIAIALVITALVIARDWRYIPALLPGLVLAQSRGGYLVLLVGLVGSVFTWPVVLLLVSAAAATTLAFVSVSDAERLLIWQATWQELGWAGHGAGSFANFLFTATDGLHYPGHAHNDYLQIAYELGLWAIPIYCVYAASISRTEGDYWPVFAGFAVAGLFFFPLYTPVTATIGAVVAGHLLFYNAKQIIYVESPESI